MNVLTPDLYTNQFDWVDLHESIHYSAKIDWMIEFIFHTTWLVIESIDFPQLVRLNQFDLSKMLLWREVEKHMQH